MKSYKKIMIATDFSVESTQAADKAKKMAKSMSADLYIVHILAYAPVVFGTGDFAMPLSADVESSLQKSALKALNKEATRLSVDAGKAFLEIGDTTSNIVELIGKHKIDLLVMGSHAHTGLGFLLGSTSNAMLHAMPCDILAVRA